MKPEVQREYDRIKAGPQSGWFTLLHHEGPVVEYSDDVMERVDYILEHKPEDEHYTRLRHIHAVDNATAEEYEAKRRPIVEEYWAKRKTLKEEYRAKVDALSDEYKVKLNAIDEEYWPRRSAVLAEWHDKRRPIEQEHQARRDSIEEEYQAKLKAIDEALLAQYIPDHSWNGKTIFGQ